MNGISLMNGIRGKTGTNTCPKLTMQIICFQRYKQMCQWIQSSKHFRTFCVTSVPFRSHPSEGSPQHYLLNQMRTQGHSLSAIRDLILCECLVLFRVNVAFNSMGLNICHKLLGSTMHTEQLAISLDFS